ncbi:hypothetical protein [Chitinophaga silvisoli]|uniref:hypothetical protein n=1 Tax=Chitinophaga silvisoli TaxID=2291814 RepID=UPI0013143BAB|nr:hypothetical protein [Chitinophaga silvisoli]
MNSCTSPSTGQALAPVQVIRTRPVGAGIAIHQTGRIYSISGAGSYYFYVSVPGSS